MTDPAAGGAGHGGPTAPAVPSIPSIRTARLELVSMSVAFLEALERDDPAAASREIGAEVPPGMPEDLANFVRYRLATLRVDPARQPWLGRAMVLDDASGARRVIGTIGVHDAPDEEGPVEIGYRVEPEYRRRGYAMEAVRAMFDWAAERGVHRFIASVSPDNEASLALTAPLGFQEVGSQIDEIDGLELVFEASWLPGTGRSRPVPNSDASP